MPNTRDPGDILRGAGGETTNPARGYATDFPDCHPTCCTDLTRNSYCAASEPVDYSGSYSQRISIPKFDPNSDSLWQVDLRSQDLTKIDMTGSLADLLYADFDSKTQWPTSDKLPADFDWQKIMELGKDPGLGIRQLHEQGITGKGVGLAIIDLTLLVDHPEYKDRLRVYEEADDVIGAWEEVQMHGPAVASIATGIDDYVFYHQGGWSWSIPYLAGMYAMAVQVKPDITPEEFWDAALKTGRTVPVQYDGKEYQLGVILDPQAVLQEIDIK